MIRYPSKAKQTKARVFFAPAHALMKFLSLRINLCNIYLLLSAPFPNMSMRVQPEGMDKSTVGVDANQLMMPLGWWFGQWCQSVDDASWLLTLYGWRWFSVDDHLMMLVSWWCWLVDDASWLMIPVSWWSWSVDDASRWWSQSVDDASQLMMPVCW